MPIQNGTALFFEVVNQTTIFGIDYAIGTILTALTLLLITRDMEKWKVMALPVMIAYQVIGVTQSKPLFLLAGVLFIIEALSIQTVGDIIGAVAPPLKSTIIKLQGKKKAKRMMAKKGAGTIDQAVLDYLTGWKKK